MNYLENTVFVTGQSKPSKDDVISSSYSVFSLCVIIDKETDRIVDIACNTIMDETEQFIRDMLCSRNIVTEVDKIIEVIQSRFFALIQKALIAALKDAQNRYLMIFPEKRK